MSYDNNNSGALFKNDDKESDRSPDYKGSAEVDRTQFWVNAWIKTSKAGKKYMSLSFTPKQAKDIKGAVASRTPEFEDIAF